MLVVYRIDVVGYGCVVGVGCVVCGGAFEYVCGCCDVDCVYGDAWCALCAAYAVTC